MTGPTLAEGPVDPVGGGNGARDGAPTSAAEDAGVLGRGGVLNLVGLLSYALLNFAVITIVTRRLGADGAGPFLEAVAAFSILSRSAMVGADLGLIRFISRYQVLGRSRSIRPTIVAGIVPVAIFGVVGGIGTFLLAHPLSVLFASNHQVEGQIATYLRVMAPFIPISAVYQTLDGAAQGFTTMVPSLVVEKISRPLLTVALLVAVFVTVGGERLWVGVGWATPWAVALVPTSIWVHHLLVRQERRHNADAQRVPGNRELARTFWRFTAPRSLGAMLQVGILWADTLLLGKLDSSRAAAVYAASTRWLVVGQFAGLAITTAFAPQVSALLSLQNKARARKLFQTATAWFILLAWPAYLTVMAFGPTLVRLFGHGFGQGADVLLIVGAGFLLAAASGPVDVVLLMGGRSSLSLANNFIALVANIGLNIVLIPHLGLRGAAISWAVALFITNVFPLIQVWITIGIHPFGPQWVLAAAVVVITVEIPLVAARALLGGSIPAFIAGVAVAGLLYVAALWRNYERLEIASLMAGARRRSRPATGQRE